MRKMVMKFCFLYQLLKTQQDKLQVCISLCHLEQKKTQGHLVPNPDDTYNFNTLTYEVNDSDDKENQYQPFSMTQVCAHQTYNPERLSVSHS